MKNSNIYNLGLLRNKVLKVDDELVDVKKYLKLDNIPIENLTIQTKNPFVIIDIGTINVYEFLLRPSYSGLHRIYENHVVENLWTLGTLAAIKSTNSIHYIATNDNLRQQFDYVDDNSKVNLENTIQFNNYLKNKNIPFLYIQAPDKINPNDNNLPSGISNGLHLCINKFLKNLSANNINSLDIRKLMILNDISFADGFFKSDHHWKPELAFWATRAILQSISNITGISFNDEYNNPENFHFDTFEDAYLGNQGKLSGLLYTGLDDFTVIHPKFDTHFTFSCDSTNFHKEGEVRDSLLWTERLSDGYFEKNMYATYNLVNKRYVVIKNKNAYNNKKMLMIQDSFANPVASFISHHFSECHFVDLRGDISNHQLLDIIEKVNPDIVCMMYYPYYVAKNTKTFNVNPLI